MKENTLIDRILQNNIISHVLFWVGLLALFTILASLNSGTLKSNIITSLAIVPSQMMAAYFLNYYQIPKLLFEKKYLFFALSILLSIYLFSAIGRISIVHLAEPFIREDFSQESIAEILADSAYLFSVYFPTVYVFALIMVVIKAIKNRFEEKQQMEILLKEKANNELKFLKGQIQPHFLFNTLNNLYSLTLTKSDLAPKVVLKLSELLDFILYQSNQKTIPIAKEIELIQGFIDLETLRYGDKLDIAFKYQVENDATQISPLILLPLVENAFKHGASHSAKKTKIEIDLFVKANKLTFRIYNTKGKVDANYKKKQGIGTENLKRQLELNYPNNHDIQVLESNESYEVKLIVDLNTKTND